MWNVLERIWMKLFDEIQEQKDHTYASSVIFTVAMEKQSKNSVAHLYFKME